VICEEHLAAYCAGLDGLPPRRERAEARRHFDGCASCRAEAERLGQLHDLLDAERVRRAGWLGGQSVAAAGKPRGGGWRLATLLAAAAAALLTAGLLLERPWRSLPSVAVIVGEASVDGRPARTGQVLRVGSSVAVPAGSSVNLHYADGTWLALSGAGKLRVGGGPGGGRDLDLDVGQILVRIPADAPAVGIDCDLGRVRAEASAFEMALTAILEGAAIDTPRTLRLAVAEGTAALDLPMARGGERVIVPAGLSVVRIEGLDRVETPKPLLSAEWQRLRKDNRVPAFADSELPAEKVPPGAWVPRWPGRRGPVPGSRSPARMLYVPELGGGLLPGGGDELDPAWCYEARADRWRMLAAKDRAPRLPAAGASEAGPWIFWHSVPDRGLRSLPLKTPPFRRDGGEAAMCWDARRERVLLLRWPGEGAPAETWSCLGSGGTWVNLRTAPVPACRGQGAMDYSPRADAVLFSGGLGTESETWTYRCGANRWERLAPAANPPPRRRHALYYDPQADLFVTYGGEGPGGTRDDVWVFRLSEAR